jgi:RimJ/RimL family protein N-acetyltransferase
MAGDRDSVSWPVRTERLTIRPATEDDLDATWRFRKLAEVGQWLTRLPTDRNAYADQYLDAERLARTLIVERDGEVVGDLMLSVQDPWAQDEVKDQAKGTLAELGWVIAPDHAGQGYATEAAAALLRICFEELGVRRVIAPCFADNIASRKLMERLGMRLEDHAVRDFLHRSGQWLDSMRYAILEDEWRARPTNAP